MLIRIASDLHLESQFGREISKIENQFLPHDDRDSESILVLAGDISSSPLQLRQFIEQVEMRFVWVVYVPGNHEFYHQDMKNWKNNVDKNFSNLNRTSWATLGVESDKIMGINFIFGTLWGDGGSVLDQLLIQNGLNDFRLITKDGKSFTVSDMVEINRSHKGQINALLDYYEGETNVVVTHHLPSYSLCHPRFGSSINGGFASNCDDLMVDGNPSLWIHGHTHDTIDTNLYGTRIVCNPYGYNGETNQTGFNHYQTKFVEILTP